MKKIAVAAGLALTFSSAPAFAQAANRTVVGMGLAHFPTYQGSDEYRTIPVPMVDILSGPIYANLRDGVGLHVVNSDAVTLGGGVGITPGYRRRDVPDGIDRLRFGAGARLFASLRAGGVIATVGGTQGLIGGSKGFIADASLSYPLILSPRVQIIPSVGATWADAKHNDRYFGIDRDEAAASGLPRFRAEGGFKDISAGIAANYMLTGRINLTASAGLTTLLGPVKDSPLVVRSTRPTGLIALSYRFGS